MANRSFVYTTSQAGQVLPIGTGLSEYAYEVHPLYLLLVAYDTRLIRSGFSEQTAQATLVGDFKRGRQAVLHLLALLLAYDDTWPPAAFAGFVAESERVLLARAAPQVVLETFDLIDAVAQPAAARDLCEVSAIYRAEVEELYARHQAHTLTAADLYATQVYTAFEEASSQLSTLAPEDVEWADFWSDTLYYAPDAD